MKAWAIICALLAMLGASLAGVAVFWLRLGSVDITIHGYIAMAIGVGLSLLLGVGLMALVFFSARRGYDDAASRDR